MMRSSGAASLADLPEAVAAAQLVTPALIVIGDVVRFRELLAPSALYGIPVIVAEAGDSRIESGPALFAPNAPGAVATTENPIGAHHG
jgi:hypothetical protein